MKLIIDIPNKIYNALTHTEFDANLVVDEMRKSIIHGTPIPDNATNGDVIINIFDVKEIHTMTTTVFTVLQDGTELEFKRSWWNNPYQKGGKEQENKNESN